MSPRTYRLGKRHSDVEATRERIVTAASELLAQPTFYSVTLTDVAKHAGVARATVYYQFESKSGLLRAVIISIIGRGDWRPVIRSGGCTVLVRGGRAAQEPVRTGRH